MKMIRGTLKLALILYICAAVSGVYVLSASARITPHEGDDETMLITIEKGDTLWDLCQEHLEDPLRWRELSKYNDFTNPHLIYPGEKLRIPLAMAKQVVEEAEGDLAEHQEELNRLRQQLADTEAQRDSLQEELSGLDESMTELKGELKALEDSLKSQEQFLDAIDESNEAVVASVKEALAAKKEAILGAIAHLDENLKGLEKLHEERKKEAENIHAHVEAIQADVKMLLTQIEVNQKAISEVKMILENAKGVHEELSTSKRALVFLTTVAAGVGLFVIGSIGGRSGE